MVSEKGYGPATIADVTARAGVSRKTFYEQFTDKQDCFLASFDVGVAVLVSHLREQSAGVEGWHDRLEPGSRRSSSCCPRSRRSRTAWRSSRSPRAQRA